MYWTYAENSSNGTKSFYADTAADVANLPTYGAPGTQQGKDIKSCEPVYYGSDCFVIETGEVYILNSSDVWTKI